MEAFGRFFLPGPTEVRPEVLRAMTAPLVGHRGPELSAMLAGADPVLRRVFGTERPVYVATSSGTGPMEGAVRNASRRRVLALVNGAFSDRFREIAGACGRRVETYEVPWGAAHDPDEVARRVRAGGFDAVTVCHSETSTGVLNPLPEIAAAVRHAAGDEVLVLVDGVTSVGGMEIAHDAWGLDVMLTGSHKALALPPGLAFFAVSERAMARAATLPDRGRYFDFVEFHAHHARHQTPNTPAVSLIYALAEQARALAAETMERRAARHAAMAARTWAWVEANARLGVSLLAPEGRRSPTVTAVSVRGRTGGEVAAAAAARGWTIGAGYGRLRDATFRIGHMGDHTVAELDALLDVLAEVLS